MWSVVRQRSNIFKLVLQLFVSKSSMLFGYLSVYIQMLEWMIHLNAHTPHTHTVKTPRRERERERVREWEREKERVSGRQRDREREEKMWRGFFWFFNFLQFYYFSLQNIKTSIFLLSLFAERAALSQLGLAWTHRIKHTPHSPTRPEYPEKGKYKQHQTNIHRSQNACTHDTNWHEREREREKQKSKK